MSHLQETFSVSTRPRHLVEITREIQRIVSRSGLRIGLCHLFLRHTSAGLIIQENADPTVQADLEEFLSRLAPDSVTAYAHRAEGVDDMPAHIKSVLSGISLAIPFEQCKLALGTWQGIYVWEHRSRPHERQVVVHINGE